MIHYYKMHYIMTSYSSYSYYYLQRPQTKQCISDRKAGRESGRLRCSYSHGRCTHKNKDHRWWGTLKKILKNYPREYLYVGLEFNTEPQAQLTQEDPTSPAVFFSWIIFTSKMFKCWLCAWKISFTSVEYQSTLAYMRLLKINIPS